MRKLFGGALLCAVAATLAMTPEARAWYPVSGADASMGGDSEPGDHCGTGAKTECRRQITETCEEWVMTGSGLSASLPLGNGGASGSMSCRKFVTRTLIFYYP